MKRKVLISFVGIALFAVAIGFGFHENQQVENLKVKNIEALAAGYDHIMDAPDGSGGNGSIPCSWACTPASGEWCVLCGGTCHAEPHWSSEQHGWCERP